MALSWLNGQGWLDVSRSERYFCLRLFNAIERDVRHFVRYLNAVYGLSLSVDADWEVAYEVSFYRDLSVHTGAEPAGKVTREFDMALLSEDTILIIEAKAQSKFSDEQTREWLVDPEQVKRATGVAQVLMIGLTSSQEAPRGLAQSLFLQPYLTWDELQSADGPYPGEPSFSRADQIHMDTASSKGTGLNADRKLSGAELVERFKAASAPRWVGAHGGLNGKRMTKLSAEGWREAQFEVNDSAEQAPNSNCFFG